jgi:hypothetical protein
MQEESELEQSFLRLDPTKVHFAVLGAVKSRCVV